MPYWLAQIQPALSVRLRLRIKATAPGCVRVVWRAPSSRASSRRRCRHPLGQVALASFAPSPSALALTGEKVLFVLQSPLL
jgi:hypothetical protein